MASLARPVVCLVTPGTRLENNGNWRTAARWAALLRGRCRFILQTAWDGTSADALIALHAHRSAESIARFRAAHPRRRIAVVLSGTDLYRDLPGSPAAQRSLDLADAIVALQDDAPKLLKEAWRRKTTVIYQSAPAVASPRKPRDRLDAVAIGHLRGEKDPGTLFRAMALLPAGLPIRVRHIGAPLDAALAEEARALQASDGRYRYSGALPHGLARAALARAHVLVHPSRMEGGANVIVEAVMSGTPVIASRISGNVGMLGEAYAGYFEPGDAAGLAQRLAQALEEPAYLRGLREQCRRRRPAFSPAAEARALRRLLADLVAPTAA